MGKTSPTVLITGASAGLGLAIAQLLMKKDYRLILTARKSSLKRFAELGIHEGENIWIRPLDILVAEERQALMQEIERDWGGLDVLVNNAGFTYRSVLEHVEQEDLLKQMITNFWAPMELVRLALPGMRKRRSGKIINVSSVGGMMSMPTMSVYSASKFALEGASEALYYEVKPWKINVVLVEPGFIRSDSFKKVKYTALSDHAMKDPSEAYFGHYYFMTEFIERVMKLSLSTPERIARKIEKVIRARNPSLRIAATPDALLFDLLKRFLPRDFYHWFLYRCLPHPDCWGEEERLRKICVLKRSVPRTPETLP